MYEVNLDCGFLGGKANEIVFSAIQYLLLQIYHISWFENLPGEGGIGFEFRGNLMGQRRLRIIGIENGGE